MADEPHSVGDILDRLDELADEKDEVSLGQTIEAFGNRSYAPFLVIIPLIDISPVGSIPGLPTVLALVIVLTAVQMLFGRKHLWLPGFLANRSLSSEKVKKAVEKVRPVGKRMDKWFHGRLPGLTKGPMVRVAAAAILVLTLAIPPLELLPLATTAPMAAIAAFGMALLVKDGLLMIVAFVAAGAALAVAAGLLSSRA
ncbi:MULTISPECIES: exopolysaccharide biosynthesis protein [unclassified Sphingomonas]|uniref:exopolysaccharide biosynthesis protein n=1 Tax=unclassified Sphingomonas TaxID=196159 RepID=UPI001D12F690|nr:MULTISPECIES: exopolysaccharide biosynthesis protein [unclassified Sphingomonas]MCC2980652.1 exopolysaccharide biosynthesis protein [Sphingomonas sp. IC4-52]MCD2316763.1 exopolysaccharide biosynthesis protein [Sphingomonas sp. IC-11]